MEGVPAPLAGLGDALLRQAWQQLQGRADVQQARQLVGLETEQPAAAAADSGGFGAKAPNGTLRPTESAAQNTEYLMNMGYDKAYAERALFLHDNDLNLAEAWLAERPDKAISPTAKAAGVVLPFRPSGASTPASPTGDLMDDSPRLGRKGSGLTTDRARVVPVGGVGGGAGGDSRKGIQSQLSAQLSGIPGASSVMSMSQTTVASGDDRLRIVIKSVEVSYSKDLDRPFFTVSLRGTDGGAIEAPIDTPPGNFRNGFIEANHTISLRTPVRLIREGSVLFIEVKHWKSKEKKFSLRGWAYAPIDQMIDWSKTDPPVRTGPLALTLMQKPAPFDMGKTPHKRPKPLTSRGNDLQLEIGVQPAH